MPLEMATQILAANPEKEIEVYSGIRDARKAGLISHDQLCAWMRNRFLPNFAAGVRRWENGELFKSQNMSFDDWLRMDYETWQKEDNNAERWISYQLLSGEPKYKTVMEFISTRIKSPSIKQRRLIMQDNESFETLRGAWRASNEKHGWFWNGGKGN
jgi:hypothetical protein